MHVRGDEGGLIIVFLDYGRCMHAVSVPTERLFECAPFLPRFYTPFLL